MTDLVQKLVGALEGMLALDEEDHQRYPGDEDVCQEVRDARAALSEAKAGGWVAVPVEPTPEMIEAARDVKRQRLVHAAAELKQGKRPDTIGMAMSVNEEWAAMLAARPLPAPPAQRGEG